MMQSPPSALPLVELWIGSGQFYSRLLPVNGRPPAASGSRELTIQGNGNLRVCALRIWYHTGKQ